MHTTNDRSSEHSIVGVTCAALRAIVGAACGGGCSLDRTLFALEHGCGAGREGGGCSAGVEQQRRV